MRYNKIKQKTLNAIESRETQSRIGEKKGKSERNRENTDVVIKLANRKVYIILVPLKMGNQ